MDYPQIWKGACDSKLSGLDIPSVKKLFAAPKMDIALFHGGGVIDFDILSSAHLLLLGATGMGKSNASGLILEQIHSAIDPETGGCVVPIFIADFQGEHKTIFEIYPENVKKIVEIKEKEYEVEIRKGIFEKRYKTFGARDAQEFVRGRTTFHFDMKPFNLQVSLVKQYLVEFLTECYNLKNIEYDEKQAIGELPRVHFFYFSEAHNFFPEILEWGERDEEYANSLRDKGKQMLKTARKLGMWFGFDSQRPSQFDKNISSQCLNRFLLPVIDRPDMEYYTALLPKIRWGDLNALMADMRLPKNRGQTFVKLLNSGAQLDRRRFLKKKSRDMGGTPNLASSMNWNYGGKKAVQEPEAQASPKVESDPYKLLGVDRHATREELRAAYKRQLRAWHPDFHQQDEEGPEYAEQMAKKINAAWGQIKRERQIS